MSTARDDDLHRRMAAVPASDLPDDLAARVIDAERTRGVRRRVAWGLGAVAAAVASGLVVTVLLPRDAHDAVPAPLGTPVATATAGPTPSVVPTSASTPTPARTPSATPSRPAGVDADHLITTRGIGPLRVGMTVAQGQALGVLVAQPGDFGCDVETHQKAWHTRHPDLWDEWWASGLSMLYTRSPAYATAEGIKVGSTLADLQAAYSDRLVLAPNDDTTFAGGSGGFPRSGHGARIPVLVDGDTFVSFPLRNGTVQSIQVGSRLPDGRYDWFTGNC